MDKVERLRSSHHGTGPQSIRRLAARGGRDARANSGESQPAWRTGRGRRRRGGRRAGSGVRPGRRTHPRPGGASDWRRGSPARKTRSSRGSWSTGSGRLTSERAWSRRPAISGSTAASPSHPELLDWLASEMVAQGWSIKSMHRLIVTSAAYRQSSRLDAKGLRARRRRPLALAEGPDAAGGRDGSRRDAGGLGHPRSRGWAVRAFAIRKLSRRPGTPAVLYAAVDPRTPGLNRRTLFRAWARGGRSPLLDAFDCPDPSTTAPRRAGHDHAAPGPLIDEQCPGALSVRRLRRTVSARGRARCRPAGRARLSAGVRAWPRARRASVGRAALCERFGAATLARAIFNSNEFLYLD